MEKDWEEEVRELEERQKGRWRAFEKAWEDMAAERRRREAEEKKRFWKSLKFTLLG